VANNTRESRLQPIVNLGLIAVAVALIITILAGWFASSQPVSSLDKNKLGTLIDNLHSYAAESAYLAGEYKEHRATNNYIEVSATRLHGAVSDLSDQIEETSIDPSIKDQAQDLSNKASDLDEALSELIQLPSSDKAGQVLDQINQIEKATETPS
jgi:hypothetical protein